MFPTPGNIKERRNSDGGLNGLIREPGCVSLLPTLCLRSTGQAAKEKHQDGKVKGVSQGGMASNRAVETQVSTSVGCTSSWHSSFHRSLNTEHSLSSPPLKVDEFFTFGEW